MSAYSAKRLRIIPPHAEKFNRAAEAVLGFFMRMKTLAELAFCVIVSSWLTGCDFPTKTIPDPMPPPFLSKIETSLDSLKIISSPNNPTAATDTTIGITAYVKDSSGIRSVHYSIISEGGNTILATGVLSDNGISPDPVTGEKIYTSFVSIHVTTESIGTNLIQIQAENLSGLVSSTLSKALVLVNVTNHAPQIFNLVMPDTVFVPASGSVNVKVSVAVADSEGLSDITSVTLTSQRPDGSTVATYPMFDDGSAGNQPVFGIPSGDAVADDGVYTLTIPLPSTTQRNTYRTFIFSATDRSGAVSNTLSKKIYIE